MDFIDLTYYSLYDPSIQNLVVLTLAFALLAVLEGIVWLYFKLTGKANWNKFMLKVILVTMLAMAVSYVVANFYGNYLWSHYEDGFL